MKAKITLTYYIALIIVVVEAMICYNLTYNKGIYLPKDSTTSLAFYTATLWYVIVTFPLTFKVFSILKKRLKRQSEEEQQRRYALYSIIRILIMAIGIMASVAGIYLFQQKPMFWLAGISAIGLIFCKPTDRKIDDDMASISTESESNAGVESGTMTEE